MTLPCYEVSRRSWKPGWNRRHAKLFTKKHDCNTGTPGKIQVVPNTRRASSIKHQRVAKPCMNLHFLGENTNFYGTLRWWSDFLKSSPHENVQGRKMHVERFCCFFRPLPRAINVLYQTKLFPWSVYLKGHLLIVILKCLTCGNFEIMQGSKSKQGLERAMHLNQCIWCRY